MSAFIEHRREIVTRRTIFELRKAREKAHILEGLAVALSNIDEIIKLGKEIENNSNQILDFTREVKGLPEKDKIKIIEALWSIIYSNKDADIYETNLMRRLAGLLYIDNKTMGDIKEKIKQKLEWHISLTTIVLSAS